MKNSSKFKPAKFLRKLEQTRLFQRTTKLGQGRAQVRRALPRRDTKGGPRATLDSRVADSCLRQVAWNMVECESKADTRARGSNERVQVEKRIRITTRCARKLQPFLRRLQALVVREQTRSNIESRITFFTHSFYLERASAPADFNPDKHFPRLSASPEISFSILRARERNALHRRSFRDAMNQRPTFSILWTTLFFCYLRC